MDNLEQGRTCLSRCFNHVFFIGSMSVVSMFMPMFNCVTGESFDKQREHLESYESKELLHLLVNLQLAYVKINRSG